LSKVCKWAPLLQLGADVFPRGCLWLRCVVVCVGVIFADAVWRCSREVMAARGAGCRGRWLRSIGIGGGGGAPCGVGVVIVSVFRQGVPVAFQAVWSPQSRSSVHHWSPPPPFLLSENIMKVKICL